MSKPAALFLFVALAPAALWAQKKPVTVETIATPPATAPPGPPVWAPDGRSFAYQEGDKVRLYDITAKNSRELFSMEEMSKAATKVPPARVFSWENRRVSEQEVQWSPSGKELLASAGGDLFLYHLDTGKWTQFTATPEAEHDPKLAPDGKSVSFVRGSDLYTLDLASGKEVRLTEDGSNTLWNAQLDWVYPEELELGTAHWWSPDSRRIAYLQFDVSREPVFPQVDLTASRAKLEPQRFPQAGDPNPEVRAGIVPAQGGRTRWLDLGDPRDCLIARVTWLPDSRSMAVVRLNRIQNRLDLLVADAETGAVRPLLSETDPYWINVKDEPHFIAAGKEFLWSSERTGFRHLYRYSIDGRQLAQLTSGDWEVTEVAAVDETAGQVYFVSSEQSPLERHLYRLSLQGGDRARLTQGAGTHDISLRAEATAQGPPLQYYFDIASSLSSPARRTIHKVDGSEWAVFREADRSRLEEYTVQPTEIVTVKAAGGATMYARLVRPAGFQQGKKYPVVVMVYGGPGAQSIRDAWQGIGFSQVLAQRGFVVWQLDNRGSTGRGHKWESVLFHELGRNELEDQKAGIQHLISMGFADPARIGVFGWSYGGFMTLYSLLHAPEVFRAGVAGAPVTDWRNYDTIYTERYMGLPQDNAEGYKKSSPVNDAARLEGKLLILHNIEDDNVHFQNSLQMADALERANKQFKMVIYPQKAHGVTGPLTRQMYEEIASFFEVALKP